MRRRLALMAAGLFVLALGEAQTSTASAVTPTNDARRIADAMSAQPKLVIGAKWVTGPSAPRANGVSGPAGAFFPTEGTDFAVLTNGDVANADPPNNSTEKTTVNGTTARFAHDVSTLEVDIIVPNEDNCVGVDLAYYSEEFPENVGSSFNDFFIAESGSDNWIYRPQTGSVEAPNNFAFDTNGKQLSVNTALRSPADTLLQYDGSTVALRARRRVKSGFNRLYFTIADGGDKAIDSAVFLDRLGTGKTSFFGGCRSGALPADRDSDGLPDEWESSGVDTNRDGKVDLDLPAFGASPNHKDLFVEIDSMAGHRLDQDAMTTVMRSFDRAPVPNPDGKPGIHMHIDNGPDSIMNPSNFRRWGDRSESTANIRHRDVLGSFDKNGDYNWTRFDSIKRSNFSKAREIAFRYALSIHQYGGSSNFSSGVSRGFGNSDFIVSLGRTCTGGVDCTFGTAGSFAGTFMHELGHTLGLKHGGGDDLTFKPNYVSIMNYLWQFDGVQALVKPVLAPAVVPRQVGGGIDNVEPQYDYSRGGIGGAGGLLGTLDENALNENTGVTGIGPAAKYLTGRVCGDVHQTTYHFNEGVDWNCDGTVGGVVSTNITNDKDKNGNPILGVLKPFDDWSTLRYKGGAVGGFGLARNLPKLTPNIDRDATIERLQAAARAIEGDFKKPKLRVRRKRRRKRVTVTFTAIDDRAIDRLVVFSGKKRKVAVAKLTGTRKRLRASLKVKPGRRVRAVAFDRAGNQVGRKVRATRGARRKRRR